jgi:hypothetical protein
MKNFNKFWEEVSIEGNPGVPGEPSKKPDESKYLSDIERRAKQRLNIRHMGDEPSMARERDIQQTHPQLMRLSNEGFRISKVYDQRGRKTDFGRRLEQLANKIILDNFGEILDGVDLDIKFLENGRKIREFMEESDEMPQIPNIRIELVKDEETKRKIHKAKLANNLIQGEAKNTKRIIASPEVKEGLIEIFGEQDGERLHQIYNQITEIADKMDWLVPMDFKAHMMEVHPEGSAGAVAIKWEKKDEEEDKEKEDELSEEDLQRILGNDLDEDEQEEIGSVLSDYTPTIMARGIDFPMLIHETVKGMVELIAAIIWPSEDASEEEIKTAEIVRYNISSIKDEVEEFRTGPEITADLRDFINENPLSDRHPNIRFFVYGEILNPENYTSEQFLELFRGILNKTPEARREIDRLIERIVREIESETREINVGEIDGEYETPETTASTDDSDTLEGEEDAKNDIEELTTKTRQKEEDYSTWSQRDIQNEIDDALDSSDYERVRMLSQYLKEGVEVYLKEIERINEGVLPHHEIKRK